MTQSYNLGFTPADRRALKCANDHKWYHITDVYHREPYEVVPSGMNSMNCMTCIPQWDAIQSYFKPAGKPTGTPTGKHESNMVLVEGWDLLDVNEL